MVTGNTEIFFSKRIEGLERGKEYFYTIIAVSGDREVFETGEWAPFKTLTAVGIQNPESDITKYELSQNYPNPFNPTTNIEFKIMNHEFVILKIYDILGHEVRTLLDKSLPVGQYMLTWDGRDGTGIAVPSGMYFYTVRAGSWSETKKMVLMR